mmetsp:Transcript_6315/g.16164  ORF Transcript_6315/g.16164 Transcript_6315/m.16164 type:complete len:230 (-) Transcript_6315:250-939(-)|eukprot:CAMPEP_0174917424 /NCGR_PEP_ID=MMETSP1355-20121228/2440_1 /TAXON_ID=464990 /ORGANISM="Hemiselmis tepida, Strain CCMP443" /LENGTH=229 /DNA_ID=CAMNT_0016162509 /DNA_START=8 /DNA_END=697 /DNA_ORIENTATION=+
MLGRALLTGALLLLCLAHVSVAEDSAEVVVDGGEAKNSAVKELDTTNFEHLTQSASGATTGDWFVEFYAPWCGHCKNLEPIWEEVATAMLEKRQSGERSAIIAKVDAAKCKYLAQRFSIAGFPTLIMFSQGKQYAYSGERTAEKLLEFAMGGFKEAKGIPVMKGEMEMNQVEKLQHLWQVTFHNDMVQIWKLHKAAFFFFVIASFLVGIIVGRFTVPTNAPTPSSKKKN